MKKISGILLINTTFAGFQAWQFHTLRQQNSDLKKVENLHQITKIFCLVNGAWLIGNHPFRVKIPLWRSLAVVWAGGGATYLFANKVENALYSREVPQDCLTYEETTAKWSSPPQEKLLKALLVMQGIQALILLSLGKNHISSLFPSIGVIAALYESSKRPWVELTYTKKDLTVQEKHFSSATLTYYAFILQNPTIPSRDPCYCFNHADQPQKAYYCTSEHTYHLGCLINHLATQVFNLGKALDGRNLRLGWLRTLTFQIQSDNLPNCPNCREQTPESSLAFSLGKITHIQP